MPIIITAPHSLCKDKFIRDCDRRAKSAALLLKNVLENMVGKDCDITTHTSTLYRPRVDGNRAESRGTKYRITLIKIINKKLDTGETFLLDMHSFPPDSTHGNYKVYFLEVQHAFRTSWSKADRFNASRAISNVFGSYGGAILRGSIENDIVLTTMYKGAHSILLEVNESRDVLGDDQLRRFFIELSNNVLLKYC